MALALTIALLSACSVALRDVTGEPPVVSLNGLEKRPENVILELALRNVNDRRLEVSAVSIMVMLDGQPLTEGEHRIRLAVSARGRDIVRFAIPTQKAGLERLEALAAGEVQRLPWSLEAELVLSNSRNRKAIAEGWLHRVPGQPNRFR